MFPILLSNFRTKGVLNCDTDIWDSLRLWQAMGRVAGGEKHRGPFEALVHVRVGEDYHVEENTRTYSKKSLAESG